MCIRARFRKGVVRNLTLYSGEALQVSIMKANDLAVFQRKNIQFNHVSLQVHGFAESVEGVLKGVATGTTVGNNQWARPQVQSGDEGKSDPRGNGHLRRR